ncbi:MAG: hypothetical protein CL534_00460 [Ahrensia sp.]|nr:hypothetical protein [Ahrensia sp.]
MNRLTRFFLRDTGGAAVVEFALLGNLFVAILLGVLAIGYTFVVRADLENSITAAERYALIHEENNSSLTDIIRSKLATYDGTKVTILLSRASDGGIDYVKADISYTVDLGISSIFGPIKISSSRVFPT